MSEHPGLDASPGYVCPYCRLSSDASSPACPNCGAPVNTRELRDDEGWVEQPSWMPHQLGQGHRPQGIRRHHHIVPHALRPAR